MIRAEVFIFWDIGIILMPTKLDQAFEIGSLDRLVLVQAMDLQIWSCPASKL